MKNIQKIALSLVALSTLAFADAHWDYEKNGPEHWGKYSELCKEGKAQSPINIETEKTVLIQTNHLLKISNERKSLSSVIDNGHAIEVSPYDGTVLTLDSTKYKLKQFHFHGKSEHTIDGRQYSAVAHFVHLSEENKIAVLAVMFEVGEENDAIEEILGNVGKSVKINTEALLPKNRQNYYHYKGSLTTPPCSEEVEWYVLKNSVNISQAQLEALRKFYTTNERPTQAVNERKIEAK